MSRPIEKPGQEISRDALKCCITSYHKDGCCEGGHPNVTSQLQRLLWHWWRYEQNPLHDITNLSWRFLSRHVATKLQLRCHAVTADLGQLNSKQRFTPQPQSPFFSVFTFFPLIPSFEKHLSRLFLFFFFPFSFWLSSFTSIWFDQSAPTAHRSHGGSVWQPSWKWQRGALYCFTLYIERWPLMASNLLFLHCIYLGRLADTECPCQAFQGSCFLRSARDEGGEAPAPCLYVLIGLLTVWQYCYIWEIVACFTLIASPPCKLLWHQSVI